MHHGLCLEFQRVFTLYFPNNTTCIQHTPPIIAYNEKRAPSSLPFPRNKAEGLNITPLQTDLRLLPDKVVYAVSVSIPPSLE